VTHRGAVSADAKTGDGAGIQAQIPRKLFARELQKQGHAQANVDELAVGVFFLPQDPAARSSAKGIVDRIIQEQGFTPYVFWGDFGVLFLSGLVILGAIINARRSGISSV